MFILNADLQRYACCGSSRSVAPTSAHTALQHSNLLPPSSGALPASGSPTDEPELFASIPRLVQKYLQYTFEPADLELPHDTKCTAVRLRHGCCVQLLLSEATNIMTDPDSMALVHGQPANSDGQDTIRSSETVGSIDDGMAWAPPHLQTSHKAPPHPDKLRADDRIPGSYMQSAVGNTRLEVDRPTSSDVISRHSPQLPLADFAKETIGVSILFCGRGLIGQWRRSRGCSGDKLKKDVAGKLPYCSIVGLADGLERRLFLGTSQTGHANAPSTCTRIICLPGRTANGNSMLPMDVTDCKYVKCKGKSPHFRVEIVQKDGTSLWLYDAGPDEFRAISDSVSECRSYAKQRQRVLEELPTASQSRLANAPEPPSALKVQMVPATFESPDKRKPSIPKLKLDGVGNYIAKPSQQAAPLPASASTAVREAEALLAVTSEQAAGVAYGTTNDGKFGNATATLTATTGHVYVQGTGPGGLHIPELQDGVSESGFQKWLFKGNSSAPHVPAPRVPTGLQAHTNGYTISNSPNALMQRVTASPPARQISTKNRNSVINVALHASEAATTSPAPMNPPSSVYSTPSRHSQKQTYAVSPSTTSEFKGSGVGTSPAQRRLPRLVSVSPQTRIDTDPHVMEAALANVSLTPISESIDRAVFVSAFVCVCQPASLSVSLSPCIHARLSTSIPKILTLYTPL